MMSWPSTEALGKRRFTVTAARVIQHIRPRALDRNLCVLDDAVIPTLALWALIRWERKLGLAALETIGVNVLDMTDQLDRMLDAKRAESPVAVNSGMIVYARSGQPVPPLNWESMLEPLLRRAEEEAADIGHGWVGTEHLLLAVIRTADSKLSSLLDQHHVTHETIKEAILNLLR